VNTWPLRADRASAGRRDRKAVGPVALTVLALTMLGVVAGCGGSSDSPSSIAPPATKAASPTGEPPAGSGGGGGPSGTLKLTGYYTYDGPFTDMFVCHYDGDGYFALEGQRPYLMNITVQKMREGTFVVHEQDPATGFSKADPGKPIIDVRRLNKEDGDAGNVLWRQAGGTITFADGGDTGTLVADYVDDLGGKEKVHAELHWTNCAGD
jgi:hypothetical protein